MKRLVLINDNVVVGEILNTELNKEIHNEFEAIDSDDPRLVDFDNKSGY